MNKLVLNQISQLEQVPTGYVWESGTMRASLWRLMLYSLASGDHNKVHANPFTSFLFKSRLGGMAYCGDLIFARTTAHIYDVVSFRDDSEVISTEYAAKFENPLRVGAKFKCRFTLLSKEIHRRQAVCVWKVEVVRPGGEIICRRDWTVRYAQPSRTIAGEVALACGRMAQSVAAYGCTAALILLVGMGFFHTGYHPLNEFCFPIAP